MLTEAAAIEREAKTRRKERKGRQVGEDDEDWWTGNKERTEEGLVVPADDHVPIGRDRTLPSHHGGQLALVHATYPSDLHDRSIDASMAGWVDGSDGTDDGQADDGPLHRAVAGCPRSRPAPFLRPAPVGRRLTFDSSSSTTSPHVQCSALARPAWLNLPVSDSLND